MNILVIRADRLGDVVLSTPVFEVIKRHYPRSRLTVLVREPIRPLIEGLPSVDQVFVYDPAGRHAGLKGFLRLIQEIRAGKFRIAIVLQSQWKLAAAVFLAAVRYRVGPWSRIYSYLLYNRGLRQRRSQVEMHETDYNLQLLRRLGIRVGTRNVPLAVQLSESARERAEQWLRAQGWDSEAALVAVHPGMGGSALNWPESHYIEFIRAMIRSPHRRVLVTAGPTERILIERVREGLGEDRERVIFYSGEEPLDFLVGLFSWTTLVVAPSTGPLHIASALGKAVLSFYPPIRVQSAIRWGPYLADETRAAVLVPEVYCGEDFDCRGNLCNYFPCMKTLTVAEAIERASALLSREQAIRPAKKEIVENA